MSLKYNGGTVTETWPGSRGKDTRTGGKGSPDIEGVLGDLEDLVGEISGSLETLSMLGEQVASLSSQLRQVLSSTGPSPSPSTTVSVPVNSPDSLTSIGSMQLS